MVLKKILNLPRSLYPTTDRGQLPHYRGRILEKTARLLVELGDCLPERKFSGALESHQSHPIPLVCDFLVSLKCGDVVDGI